MFEHLHEKFQVSFQHVLDHKKAIINCLVRAMFIQQFRKQMSQNRGHDNSYTRHFVHTTFRTHGISYKNQNQTFRTKAKPDISYKNETRHFVQFILYNLLL